MAAKYWPRNAATAEASGLCDAPAATVTALPPEELGEVLDGLGADTELPWAAGEALCAGDDVRADWVGFPAASACDLWCCTYSRAPLAAAAAANRTTAVATTAGRKVSRATPVPERRGRWEGPEGPERRSGAAGP